jgi:hypothetical protein
MEKETHETDMGRLRLVPAPPLREAVSSWSSLW